jgi:hypothetical protein
MNNPKRAMVAVATIALVVAGCRGRRSAARDAGAADVAPAMAIVLDGTEVARVTAADLAARRPLAELLPADARDPATWELLDVASADGRAMTIEDVADRYPGDAVTLYLDPAGRPSIGLFAPVRPDQPPHVRRALEQPAVSLVGAVRVVIDRTAPATAPAEPPHSLVVAIGGRTIELDAARLDTLPRLAEAKHKGGGWDLRDVLALAGVGVGATATATITAVGREGSATFSRADLDAPDAHPTLRRNRRGQLRLGVKAAVIHDVLRLDVVSP